MRFWQGFWAIYRRELFQDLTHPVAYVFIAGFLSASVLATFQLGGLFEAGRADLSSYFQFHPWLYAVLMPALAMRTWSDEVRRGTLETLLALPVSRAALVLAKFAAAWTLVALMLVLGTTLWLGIALLGPVDHGATLVGFCGSFLMAGAYLAIGMAASAASSSQAMSFVIATSISVLLTAAGLPIVSTIFAGLIGDQAALMLCALSIQDHFDGFQRGVIEVRAIVFFMSLIAAWLAVTFLFVTNKRVGGL
ncbi:ABC transporter permease [Candidatus Phycosocius spiralis]|uniref:ABC transporter permease n=1 Tax=Candidatus Phycosocius spiralis TaxID=2815099 RepID=A0ABQ4PTJ0_9PROT|nr:ABC transporter permease [Candidatus Phycosocius spiralis]GIU66330.1 ABC transporter permease [Candidatus Phycosocius spiralis]